MQEFAQKIQGAFRSSLFRHTMCIFEDMKRSAHAVWNGNLKLGHGLLGTESGAVMNALFSFESRFKEKIGINPEELLAAAQASCYSMALASELESSGLPPAQVEIP